MKKLEFRKLIREEIRKILENEKTIESYGPRLMDGLKKSGFNAKFTNNETEKKNLQNFVQKSDEKLAVVYYDPAVKYISIATNKNNQDEAFKVADGSYVKQLMPDGYVVSKDGAFFVTIQGKL